MEIWFLIGVILTSFTEAKHQCQLEYFEVHVFKELHCPNISSLDIDHITWHYRQTINDIWTSFPFVFCDCKPPYCDKHECEVSNGVLRLRYAESEYEGFYTCRRNQSQHCFHLQLYNCNYRQEQLIFEPPKTYPTTNGRQLAVKCGADFGCDKTVMGNISWEYNGQMIKDSTDNKYKIYHRQTITYIETELIIENVDEDDFKHPFVCIVTEKKSSKIRKFNVSLIDTDPRLTILHYWIVIVIVIAISVIFVLIFMVVFWCLYRKYPDRCFFILTHCSCLSRCLYTDYSYHVFILHEQDDSEMAHSVKNELSHHSYSVVSMEDILLGSDFTKEFKELSKQCASLIVIYPEFHISESFDHQITIGKQNIKPYHVSALVPQDRQELCKTDPSFKHLGLKQFLYGNNVLDQLSWRLPKLRQSKIGRNYTIQKTNSWC